MDPRTVSLCAAIRQKLHVSYTTRSPVLIRLRLHDMSILTMDRFEASLQDEEPPAGLTPPLRGLWLASAGRWDEAHAAVQDETTNAAAWVHAYLHREEGDLSNAAYWYRRAGKPTARGNLESEWRQIALSLLELQ